jgi:hypothetical protein
VTAGAKAALFFSKEDGLSSEVYVCYLGPHDLAPAHAGVGSEAIQWVDEWMDSPLFDIGQ